MRDVPDTAREAGDVRLGAMTGSLGFLLRLAQLASFREFFEDLGGYGVRPGEITVLMLIGENPGIRQGVLARRLMIKRAHMTKMVRAMEEAGLVTRTVPEDDRRSVELRLSDRGRARIGALGAPFLAHEMRAARGLTAREEAELKRLLRKYLDLPEPVGEGGA
jgi:DNA-binding MarR family transcriptional regulator